MSSNHWPACRAEENPTDSILQGELRVFLTDAQASFVAGHLEDAADLYRKILAEGEPPLPSRIRATVLNNLGLVEVRQGRHDAAIGSFQRALVLLTEDAEGASRAEIMGNIGSVCRDRDQGASALRWYRESLAIFEGLLNKRGMADQHTNIGYILATQGEPAEALEHYRIACALYAEIEVAAGKAASVRINIDILESDQ